MNWDSVGFREPDSLNRPVGHDQDAELGEFIAATSVDPIEKIDEERKMAVMLSAIAELNDPRETYILRRRFDGWTLDRIGAKLGITRERVRQLQSKAVRQLCVRFGVPWNERRMIYHVFR